MTKYDKAVSVCFSGHRNVPFDKRRELKQRTEQREERPNLFGLSRVVTDEGEANVSNQR